MRTYLVFNKETGEVIQTHIDADLETPPDELLKTVDPSHDRRALDVLIVDDLVVDEAYRVDITTNEVSKIDRQEAAGFGGGATGAVGLRQRPKFVKTVYTQESPTQSQTD